MVSASPKEEKGRTCPHILRGGFNRVLSGTRQDTLEGRADHPWEHDEFRFA